MPTHFSKSLASKAALLLLSLASFSLTSCLDDVETPEPTPVSFISFYHGSPNAPDLDIQFNSQVINNQPIKYASYTGYEQFIPGSYDLKITPVNTATAYVDSTVTFEDQKIYSVFAVNTVDDMELLVVQDKVAEGAVAGQAALRVVNLSPDAPALAITTTGAADEELASDLAFKEITPFQAIDSGKYNFTIKAADSDEVLVSINNTNFMPGASYTLIIRGFKTPPADNLNVLSAQFIRNF